jgi:type IV pilus assembly protein PilE
MHMNMNEPVLLRHRQWSVRGQRGFTLIELLIAMVIASILAAIAIPSYSSYIMKSRRTEAKSALLNLAALEERYFSTNNSYTQTPSDLGYATAAILPLPVGSGLYYNITNLVATPAIAPTSTTTVGTPWTYTITATAIGTQANDTACATFTITSGGVQTATSAKCW